MYKNQQVDTESVQRIISKKLSYRVGNNRCFSDADLEDLTGIKARTIKSYRLGTRETNIVNWLLIANVIESPNFINSLLSLIGFGGAYKIKVDKDKVSNPHTMLSSIAENLKMIATHLEDGKHDHVEKAKEKQELRMLASELLEYIEGLD